MPHLARGRALIIGVGTYLDAAIQSVPQTAREAEQIAAALQDKRVAAYPPAHVTLLTHQQTTRQKILAALQTLAEHVRADDTVFIFFSGHGAWGDDGVYHFGTHDVELAARGRFKAHTGLSQTELLERLRAIPAKKVLLIINACFSGVLNPTLDAAPVQSPFGAPPSERVLDELLASGEGRAIITASRDEQPSRFDWNEPHTFFGQALLDGLRGKEIATRSGYIGLAELYEFIYARVLARTQDAQPPQEPMLSLLRGVGAFPIAFARGVNAPTDASLLQPISTASKGVRVVALHLEQDVGAGNQGVNLQAGGDVKVAGDVVGGNKIVEGDEVHGDKVLGAKYVVIQSEKLKPKPQPRLFTREWWIWIRQHPKWLVLYVLAGVVLLVTLSAGVGIPTVQGWKPISEQNLGRAKWITRIERILFVMTEPEAKCGDPRNPGLWKSNDQGAHWDPIYISELEFQGSTKCDLSSIIAMAPSPTKLGRLYAATADVGLLVSDNNGNNWRVLNNDPERQRLSALAVLAQPDRLYVVGRTGAYGLYVSKNETDWTRLDGTDLCKQESYVSLPTAATKNGLLIAADGFLYIAPADTSMTPDAEADIYYSGDGGICWKRVHKPGTRQTVTALTAFPDANSRILFSTWNFTGLLGLGRSVWKWSWGDERETAVGELGIGVQQLYADSTNGYWYAATPFGFVFRGALMPPENTVMLAAPFSYFAAFTSDFQEGPPLLLRSGRVFRQGTVGWWQGFFP